MYHVLIRADRRAAARLVGKNVDARRKAVEETCVIEAQVARRVGAGDRVVDVLRPHLLDAHVVPAATAVAVGVVGVRVGVVVVSATISTLILKLLKTFT